MTDWLIGTLLATSGLIILVLLIREPVRRHFGARVAYGLWLIPAARLLMPTLTETVERPVTIDMPPRLMSTQLSVEPMLLSSVATPQPSLLDQLGGWPTIVLTIWLGVAAGLFLARMLAFRAERGAIMARATKLGRVGSIRIVRSAEVAGPLAFGIFDRVVAVPADFERLYDNRERRLALEHEIAHHQSGDLIANLFAFVLLCLQWFNPLAWFAHAAFRFDQEAACDARVLDKARADDRANYGRAIAKAASGRALLFASALDRRNTLHRRLKSMLSNTTSGRRNTGRAIVAIVLAAALPLTATRAINYVDVPQPAKAPAAAAPKAAASPQIAHAPLAAVSVVGATAVAQAAPTAPAEPPVHVDGRFHIDGREKIVINGRAKKWSELTAEEKTQIRRSIARAKQELARTRIDREQIRREVRKAMAEAMADRSEHRRDLDEARADIERALREIDAHKVEIRRSGQDPEQLKATIRASLRAVQAIDVDAIRRQALASIDHRAIEAGLEEGERSVARARDDIERIEQRLDTEE